MFRKAHILSFGMMLFLSFIELMVITQVRINHIRFEFSQYTLLESFSYLESYVLQKTIERFRKEQLDNFSVQSRLGEVHIHFNDEIAWIHYDLELPRYARLDYDLVFDSSIAYTYLDEALFDLVDIDDD